MKLRKFSASAVAVLFGLISATAAVSADTYPSSPVRLIVPYGTGGITDIVARVIAPGMAESLRQPVIVENRPGANGRIGLDHVAKAVPDGYTVTVATSELAVNPVLFKRIPYDAKKDFAPISLVTLVPTVLVVHPSVQARSVRELIALAKSNPRALNYGSAGTGSANHLATEAFKNAAGIEALHIPYKGGGAVMSDLVGGQVQFTFATIPAALSHIQAGRLRALAVSNLRRSPALPDVPPASEAGVPGFDFSTWLGIFAPAGTPAAVIEKLHDATAKAINRADIAERLKAQGTEIVGSSPEQLRSHLVGEMTKWEKLAKDVKFEMAD